MKSLLTLVWLLACCVPTVSGSILDLGSMIKDVTGRNALLNYGFYGCYCGWGGKGTPLDETDRCCFDHDQCYGQLEDWGCDIRTHEYKYRYAWGNIYCGSATFCQRQLCACDVALVFCLKRNLEGYNRAYQFYPNFLCYSPQPRMPSRFRTFWS